MPKEEVIDNLRIFMEQVNPALEEMTRYAAA
jgi:hypothetical protein